MACGWEVYRMLLPGLALVHVGYIFVVFRKSKGSDLPLYAYASDIRAGVCSKH